jgi:hypothetical protein
MKLQRTRRLATWQSHYRGLQDPRAGVPILDRNLRVGVNPSGFRPFLLFLGCWWCFCAYWIHLAFTTRSLEGLVFGLLLLGFSLVILHEGVRRWFGREQVRIGPMGLDYLRIDGLLRRRRVIPFHEIRRLAPYTVMVGDERNEGLLRAEHGLAIDTLGGTVRVGQSRDRDEVGRLQEQFERHLRDYYPAWDNVPEYPDCDVLDASGLWPELPSSSTLSCHREWDRTEFSLWLPRNHWLVASLLWLGLSLLLLAVWGASPLVACLMVAGWLGVMLLSAPVRRRWIVRPGEVTTSIPGLGPLGSRTIEIEWLDRIWLRSLPPNAPWASRFELALVGLDGEVKVVFGPLAEREARWMGEIVADVLKDALPKSGQEVYRWSVTVDPPAAGSRAMADVWLDEVLADPGTKGRPE